MGAGASAEDRRELQRCFAEFQEAPGAGDGLSDDDFEALMREHAPLLYCKAEESGDAPAAARALRVQFATAREKLAARDAPPVPGAKDRLAQRAAARLKAAHPAWASDAPTNLQKGLVHGMLRSHALRTVTFSLGGETVAALLDTGAERSGMSIDAADRCGLRALIDGSFSRTVRGVGTAFVTPCLRARSLLRDPSRVESSVPRDGQGATAIFRPPFGLLSCARGVGTAFVLP